jgi:hypothetical protein
MEQEQSLRFATAMVSPLPWLSIAVAVYTVIGLWLLLSDPIAGEQWLRNLSPLSLLVAYLLTLPALLICRPFFAQLEAITVKLAEKYATSKSSVKAKQ